MRYNIGFVLFVIITITFLLLFWENVLYNFGILKCENDYTNTTIQKMRDVAIEAGIINMPIIDVETRDTIDIFHMPKDVQLWEYPSAYAQGRPLEPDDIKTTEGKIVVRPDVLGRPDILSHEVAHHVCWCKGIEGDHHSLLEFRKWEACLHISFKTGINICKYVNW